jgi:nucleolar MIF4G domain-containing protein 1
MGLQFNLWSAFREWGENTDEEEWAEEPEDILDDAGKLRKSVNLAKLYGSLVAEGVLSLQILKVYLKPMWSLIKKVLGFINLQPLTKTFLEVFFTQVVLHSQGDDNTSRNAEPLLQCAYRLADSGALAKGIDWYLRKKNVEKAGLSSGEAKSCVVWGINILRKGIAEVLEGQ